MRKPGPVLAASLLLPREPGLRMTRTAEGRMEGQKESGPLVMALSSGQPAQKRAPPLGFLVASQSFPLGFVPI